MTRGALEDGALTQMNPPGMTLLRFDDGPSVTQALLSGQIDAMGGGDYGEIYLRKGAKGEEYEQKFPLRAAHFGIGIRRGNPELLQWLNTLRVPDQEQRRARCDLSQVPQQRANDAACRFSSLRLRSGLQPQPHRHPPPSFGACFPRCRTSFVLLRSSVISPARSLKRPVRPAGKLASSRTTSWRRISEAMIPTGWE